MKKTLMLAVLLAAPAGAADICIVATPNICHTTTADENTGAIYYRDMYDDSRCSEVDLPAGCTQAEYVAAGGTDLFFARDADGAKQFFMERVIKAALTAMVAGYDSDFNNRARDAWGAASAADKAAACVALGLDATCR